MFLVGLLGCAGLPAAAEQASPPQQLVDAHLAVERVRGHRFVLPPHEVMTPEQVSREAAALTAAHPRLTARLERLHRGFGVAVDGTPDGVGAVAFYRPDTAEMVFVDAMPSDPTVLHHELTHALQHQRFGAGLPSGDETLDQLWAEVWTREGEAVLVAHEALHGPGSARTATTDDLGPFLPGRTQLPLAHRFHVAAALLPYEVGAASLQRVVDGGWEAVDGLWATPPASVEALAEGARADDPPWRLHVVPDVPAGWTAGAPDVLGYGFVAALAWAARPAGDALAVAHGWDGDCFVALEHADGRVGIVWRSRWETEADARRFAQLLAGWRAGGVGTVVERRGVEVLVVRGVNDRALEASMWAPAFTVD